MARPGRLSAPFRKVLRPVVRRSPLGRYLRSQSAAAAQTLVDAGVVDVEWYRAQLPRAPRDPYRVALHYVTEGWRAGLTLTPLFDVDTAVRRSRRSVRTDPLTRYLAAGSVRRPPHPFLDAQRYLEEHPEAADHPGGVIGHFLASAGDAPPPALPEVGPLRAWDEVRADLVAAARELAAQRELTESRWVSSIPGAQVRRTVRRARRWLVTHRRGDRPLVTVVMPVRDRRHTVGAAIESVRAQSLSDWELVVVDDGSTDGTPDVVREVAAGDPRVRVVERAHGGVSAARNAGIEVARGRFVAFLDSDNEWRPDHLMVTVHALVRDQRDAVGAHTAIRRRGQETDNYLWFDGTVEHLRVVNHVDMNALVVRTDVAREIGGFDESLRRMVDWDFVIRVAERGRLPLVPYVGVDYEDAEDRADRISIVEPMAWGRVVVQKHLVDWSRAERDRVVGRLSVLVVVDGDWERLVALVDDLLARTDHDDLEVVVVDNCSPDLTWQVLRAKYSAEERVVLRRLPRVLSAAVGLNVALCESSGEHVLLLDHRHDLSDGALPLLLDALRPGVVGVQPLVHQADGTVGNAGLVFTDAQALPVPFLAGHPPQDALGERERAVHAISRRCMLLRAEDVVRVRGLDPLFESRGDDVDLCLRLGGDEAPVFRVVTDARAHEVHDGDAVVAEALPDDARVFLDRWSGRLPSDAEKQYATTDVEVVGLRPLPSAGEVEPVVVRTPRLEVREGPPVLRWSVKVAAPAGPRGEIWGDTAFGEALARALRELGQQASVDRSEAYYRTTSHLDDVVVVLRGLDRVDPQPGRVSMLWVISHPELVTAAEVRQFDHVYAASLSWSAWMSGLAGVPVEPLLQATDPALFHPGRRGEVPGDDVLFVGSSRNVFRPVVRDALAQGVDVSIYGPRWTRFLGPGVVKAESVPNDELGAHYASAGVVLNDHWTEMAEAGFLSNRLFDAVASGAIVVSDPCAGIDEVFEGMVQVFRTPEDLGRLAGPGRDAWFPSAERRAEISARVRAEHSFAARARTMVEQAARLHRGARG